jgi:hypothetical protein
MTDSIRDAINNSYYECGWCLCAYRSKAAADACCRDSTRPWDDDE